MEDIFEWVSHINKLQEALRQKIDEGDLVGVADFIEGLTEKEAKGLFKLFAYRDLLI